MEASAEMTARGTAERSPAIADLQEGGPAETRHGQRPLLYLVNQYPAVTHTFIRREILALERLGHHVERVSLRAGASLVDPLDRVERKRTTRLLERPTSLLAATTWACARRPGRLLRAFRLSLRLMRRSDRSPARHIVSLIEACAVARIMEARRITHIHAHFGTNPAEIALLAATIAGGTYSFTVHGYDEYDRPQFLGLALKIRGAAFVAAVSHYGRAQLMRWCDPDDRGKIALVRCGLDSASLDAMPSQDHGGRRFVCVARLCREKAQETLIEAAALLMARGEDFELTLIGDGETRPALEEMIGRFGIGGRVRLLGWRSGDEVRREMQAARALVVPSFAENLPVVIMEAMALGKPVIATAIAGIPELVATGETGWLVPAGSVDDLADAMADCLKASPEDLGSLGRCGRARVARMHDVDREAARLSARFEASEASGATAPAVAPARG
jgi:colanic acid/amylovoran biosynthesis glycosyltransferase